MCVCVANLLVQNGQASVLCKLNQLKATISFFQFPFPVDFLPAFFSKFWGGYGPLRGREGRRRLNQPVMHSTGHDGVGLSSHFYSLFASFLLLACEECERKKRCILLCDLSMAAATAAVKKALHTFVRFEQIITAKLHSGTPSTQGMCVHVCV